MKEIDGTQRETASAPLPIVRAAVAPEPPPTEANEDGWRSEILHVSTTNPLTAVSLYPSTRTNNIDVKRKSFRDSRSEPLSSPAGPGPAATPIPASDPIPVSMGWVDTGQELARDSTFPFHGLPGPELLSRLVNVDSKQLSAQNLGDGIAGWERLAAWVKSQQLAWISELDARCVREFAERTRGMLVDEPAGRVAVAVGKNKEASAAELSAILTISHREASNRIETATALHSYLFETFEALKAGAITSGKAELLAIRLSKVDPQIAIAVEASTLRVAHLKLGCPTFSGPGSKLDWFRWSGKGDGIMAGSRRRYSPEFKEESVREVVENSRSINEVASSLGVAPQSLGNWVRAYRESHENGEELTVQERARIRELEREVRDLREQVEFLGKASAFFAAKRR